MMSSSNLRAEQQPDRREERLQSPSIRDYFIDNGKEIQNEGYIDEIKRIENMRIITLNIKGCRMKNQDRITEIRESMQKYQIDVALFSEPNTKWNTRNTDRIENEMRKLGKGTICVTSDSKQWNMTSNDYLPGGMANVITQRYGSRIDETMITKGRLGNWIAIPMCSKGKRLEIISLYRIPTASESDGIFSSLAQYQFIDAKAKKSKEYRKEIFDEIKKHIRSNNEISDIIIAGDYNQCIYDREVQKFHEEIGVKEVHVIANNIEIERLDRTYKNGSKPIDSIAATCGIMDFVEGCKLLSYNEIVETDHRAYMVDVNIEEYFDENMNEWDNINHVILNPARRSHRERFVEVVEELLQIYPIEDDLMDMEYDTTRQRIENVDQVISKILDGARKKVEGMKRNIPFSQEKKTARALVLYAKMQIRKLKGVRVDEEVMAKRQKEANLDGIEYNTIEEAKEALRIARQKWELVKEKGKEIREAELLDYHTNELNVEDIKYKKKKKKIIRGIKRTLQRYHEFRYLSRHAGKGRRDNLKRIHECNDENVIVKSYTDRQSIEEKIIDFNTKHFMQAHQSIAFKDRIYEKLKRDNVRDKVLKGELEEQECDDARVFEFLKLLKQQNNTERQSIELKVTMENWTKTVKQSKKRSASSIFSKRTYAVYKCALGSEQMSRILVKFYQIVIKNRYYLKRWEKIVDVILDKGKGMILGKLRTITLIEADLQYIMRIFLNDEKEERIETDRRVSKSNYGSRKNYSIETALLEKRLIMDNSMIKGQPTIYHLTDLKSCYDRQLMNIGGLIEESMGRNRDIIKILTNLIPRWQHYVSTAYGISEKCYGGSGTELAGTGQGNKFSGDLCRDTSSMIIKVLENKKLGVEYKSKLTDDNITVSAIAFVDDTDLVAEGPKAEEMMEKMLVTYNDLHTATGGLIEQSKSSYFAWRWKWQQGNKKIIRVNADIKFNNERVKEVEWGKSEKTLGVYMNPAMKWEKQFQVMLEKMKEATYKLRNVEIAAPVAHLYYNAYLIKKVYFGSGVLMLTEKQEKELRKIYEPILLRKMNLSEKFPRHVLYSRKTALGVGLLAPSTIVDILSVKLYMGHQRMNSRVSKMIQINEDNVKASYGYSKSVMETKRKYKPNEITWNDEIQVKLEKRQLTIHNRTNEPKWMSRNNTIMDYAVKYIEAERLQEKILAPINHVRLHKRMVLPCELVGFNGERTTKEMREHYSQSCVKWTMEFEKVPKPSKKSYQIWEEFIKWLKEQKIQTIVDFEPWIQTNLQISPDREYIRDASKEVVKYYKRGEIMYGHQVYKEIDDEVSIEWKKMIAELKENGRLEVHGIFYSHQEDSEIQYQPFDEIMTRSIIEGKAVAATDASVKDGQMGGRWILSNTQQSAKISGELYHKEWDDNTIAIAETITLLELLTVIERRGRHIENGSIEIGFDHKRQYRQITGKIMKSNIYAQEGGAEIAAIKEIIDRINFEIKITLVKSHDKQIGTYQENPIKHIIRECDKEARRTREQISTKPSCTNIKFEGRYCLRRDGKIQSRAIKEIIRIADAREEEKEYAKEKFNHRAEFIDMEARNAFSTGEVTTAMIKLAHGFNHYGLRDAMINDQMFDATCPRCEETETWDHVIKCRKTLQMRRQFIMKLVIELARNKSEEIHVEEIMSFVEDILRYLENEQEEEYEMNQQYVGMRELFRGFVVIDWEGTNFGSRKYRKVNKIIVQRCVEYYYECWKHRNEEHHNEEKQRKKLLDWYEKVKQKAESCDDPQVRLFVEKKSLDVEKCRNETIKRWIFNLKEFEKRMEKTKKNDIRRYFEV